MYGATVRVALNAFSDAPPSPFEGRASELAELARAATCVQQGQLSLVLVEGESGIGKSALLREFMRRQLERRQHTWAVHGRCYEHERVPYKAFDGCLAGLAKLLTTLDPAERATCVGPCSALLMELFPILRSVPGISGSSLQGVPAEPSARRSRAFQVFAQMLGKLAERRPIVLLIDDLQWADQESFRLLSALAQDHAPPVLLACTVRPRAELSLEMRRLIDEVRGWSAVRFLSLEGLGAQHTVKFAGQLLGARATNDLLLQVASESKGHPMLIQELARYAGSDQLLINKNLTLDAALSARISALTPRARSLLELVALSIKPHSERVFARALGDCDGHEASELVRERLLRRNPSAELTPAHDRIREVTVRSIAAERVSDLHAALARELLASDEADAGELAFHWDRAGDRARALAEYRHAADSAFEALAFARAAELYGRAIELMVDADPDELVGALTSRAQAYVGLGQSAEAAALFAEAARRSAGGESLRLRVLAAQHQIQSAQFETGVESARSVLAEISAPLPRGTFTAIARIMWERVLLSLRSLEVKRDIKVKAEDKRALDVMAALLFPISWATDFAPGTAINMHYLRRALSVGDPGHAARALCHEAVIQAMLQKIERSQEIERAAFVQADYAGDPVVHAYVRMMRGTAAVFRAKSRDALEDFEAAEDMLVSQCPGEAWLLMNVRTTLSVALYQVGEYRRVATRTRSWMREARARGDAFAPMAFLGVGHGFIEALMRDAPEEVLADIEQSMLPWQNRPFGMAQHGEIVVRAACAAYAGSFAGHEWLLEHSRQHDKELMHRTSAFRASLLTLRSMAGLAAYAADPQRAGEKVLVTVARDAHELLAMQAGWGRPFGRLFAAQIEGLRGKDSARGAARAAFIELTGAGQTGLAHAARYLEGVLEGDTGRGRREVALDYYRKQGFRDPWRGITMYVPAARLLEHTGTLPVLNR